MPADKADEPADEGQPAPSEDNEPATDANSAEAEAEAAEPIERTEANAGGTDDGQPDSNMPDDASNDDDAAIAGVPATDTAETTGVPTGTPGVPAETWRAFTSEGRGDSFIGSKVV
jgi:hypothetical protein